MIDIEKLKRELIARYKEDRAMFCSIEVYKTGILKNEILVIIHEVDFIITERFKEDTGIEDIFEIIDKAIYKEDYKCAYFKLKEFWLDNKVDVSTLKKILKNDEILDKVFELKKDEELIALEKNIFSVSFNDEELKYQIGKYNKVFMVDNTINFINISLNNIIDEVENGVNRLQIIRKELKKERV